MAKSLLSDEAKKKLIKVLVDRYKFATKKAMESIEDTIIYEWFGEYNYESMANSVVYQEPVVKYNGDIAEITVTSYIDPSRYNHEQSAQGWVNRHKSDVNITETPEEFVMGLQLYQGIIGLPLGSMTTDWTNNNYIERTPLLYELITNSRWNSDNWKKEVMSWAE